MAKFAFIIHPVQAKDVAQRFRLLGKLPEPIINAVLKRANPVEVATLTGLSPNVEGIVMGCPLTLGQMYELDRQQVIDRVKKTVETAAGSGASIIGAGTLPQSIVDNYHADEERVSRRLITGEMLCRGAAVTSIYKMADHMGKPIQDSEITVLGAVSPVGRVFTRILSKSAGALTLVDWNIAGLERIASHVLHNTGLACKITTDIHAGLKRAGIVVDAAGILESEIIMSYAQKGAVLYFVSKRFPDAELLLSERSDLIFADDWHVLPPGELSVEPMLDLADCFSSPSLAETMVRTLLGDGGSSLQNPFSANEVESLWSNASEYGFRLAGIFNGEELVLDDKK